MAHNPVLAIDAYDFTTKGTVSYRPPLSKVAITFENKFVETSQADNGDFSNGITNWDNGGSPNDWDTFTVISEELNLAIGTTALENTKEFSQDMISLTEVNSTDRIVVSFRAIVDTLTESNGPDEAPFVSALITGPQGTRIVNFGQMSEEWKLHKLAAAGNPLMLGTGNYTVKIIVDEEDLDISALAIRIDDVEVSVDLGGGAVTLDKVITITNDAALDDLLEEYTTKVGDSPSLNDQGSIRVGATLTTFWNTFGLTENEPVIDLLGAFQLNARQAFTEYLSLQISDLSDTINAGTIITIASVPYRIIRFNKQYKQANVDVDLLEINS